MLEGDDFEMVGKVFLAIVIVCFVLSFVCGYTIAKYLF